MPETKAVETAGTHQPDCRIIVLVLIGLCICLPHLYDAMRSAPEPRQPEEGQPRLVWLETTAVHGNGLYWLEDQARSWPPLFTALGRPSPPAPLLPLSAEIPSAYRLPAVGPPQTIPLPAQLAPIFFQPLPINQASAETLMTIPGIGQRLAEAIIAYRAKTGGIKDRAALMAIDGIGAKKAAIIADHVRFD